MTKNQFMSVTIALAMLVAANSAAQTFPTKLIRLIVPFAPGGGNDVLGRMFALRMSESLAQTVVVDNRAGGGGNIGTEMVAHAPPDGYTLLYTTNSVAVAPSLYSKLNYSLKDLAPISLVADFPIAIVIHPSVPARNVKELIALAQKRGGLNYGSTGTGSTNHLTGVLLNSVAGINNTHVPYKGAGPMMTAIISGEVEIATPTVFTALPYVQAGRLRPLAVTTPNASPMLPGVPAMASFYPGFDTNVWHGYFTTAGTPAPVIGVLHREIIKALRSTEIRESLINGGAESVGTTPEEFGAILTRDVAKYSKLVQISGAKAD
jgi:tripartite-type tricarboxylate transporter receptor subunit TctC